MPEAQILGGGGTLALDDDVFGAPFNGPLVHECVVAELAARRQGTHATKTRGTVFGPSPRHYVVKVNRKARKAALRSALSIHAERGSLFGLDAARFDAPSTRRAAELLADRRAGSVLVVLGAEEAAAAKSFRNLEGVAVHAAENAGVADVVGAATLVASQAAVDALTARARRTERGGSAAADVESSAAASTAVAAAASPPTPAPSTTAAEEESA